MRTLLDLERVGTGRWRLRVRREDPRGNCSASATVEGETGGIVALAAKSVRDWAELDEERARERKRGQR